MTTEEEKVPQPKKKDQKRKRERKKETKEKQNSQYLWQDIKWYKENENGQVKYLKR